jgi:drug/metabolite transporter (DMT)-like permease
MNESLSWKASVVMTLAAACWGLGTVMSKGVLDYLPPPPLLVVQLTGSLLFLWTAVLAVRTRYTHINRRAWRLGLTGLLNPGLAYTFGLLGLALTTASMSTLIWAAEPALILLLAWLLLRERLTRPLLLMSAVALAGAIMIVGTGSGGMLSGNLLVALAVFCCAVYTVWTRHLVAGVKPLVLTTLQQTVSLVWALLIWPLEWEQVDWAVITAVPPTIWLLALASGVVYYGLAFWFYITGLKEAPASLASLFLNLIPIFGVSGAMLFLGERLGPVQWVGAALIITAVLGLSYRYRYPTSPLS